MILLRLPSGEAFAGATCIELVQAMQAARRFAAPSCLDEYIAIVAADVRRLAGVELRVPPGPPESRAVALVGELLRHGLAKLQEGPPEASAEVSGTRIK